QQAGQLDRGVPVAGLGGKPVKGGGFGGAAASVCVVGESGGVVGVVVGDECLPDEVGQRGGAACPEGPLVQVVGDGVAGDASHAGGDGDQRCGGAVHDPGGVVEGLVEPVGRRGRLFGGGEVAGGGGV